MLETIPIDNLRLLLALIPKHENDNYCDDD
jgi:hypothetical protein